MEKIMFENVFDLAECFMDTFTEVPCGVNVVADYYTIRDLLKVLTSDYDAMSYDILLRDPEITGYNREYVLMMDIDGYVYVAPVYTGVGYVELDNDDFTFVFSDTNSAFLRVNKSDNMVEFDFYEDEECDGDCDNCQFNDKEEKPVESIKRNGSIETSTSNSGITQSWTNGNGSYFSRSFYSSDKNEMNKIKDEWTKFAHSFN